MKDGLDWAVESYHRRPSSPRSDLPARLSECATDNFLHLSHLSFCVRNHDHDHDLPPLLAAPSIPSPYHVQPFYHPERSTIGDHHLASMPTTH